MAKGHRDNIVKATLLSDESWGTADPAAKVESLKGEGQSEILHLFQQFLARSGEWRLVLTTPGGKEIEIARTNIGFYGSADDIP